MPTIEMPAEVFMEHRGVTIYHVYKSDHFDEGVRQYWYSLDPDSSDSAILEYQGFDIRDLPAWKDCHTSLKPFEDALRLAIDRGELNELITEALQEGGVEMDVELKCTSCVGTTIDLEQLLAVCPACKRGTMEVKIPDA